MPVFNVKGQRSRTFNVNHPQKMMHITYTYALDSGSRSEGFAHCTHGRGAATYISAQVVATYLPLSDATVIAFYVHFLHSLKDTFCLPSSLHLHFTYKRA